MKLAKVMHFGHSYNRSLLVSEAGLDVGDSVLWSEGGFVIVRLMAVEDGDRTFEARDLIDGNRDFITDLDSLSGDFVIVKA